MNITLYELASEHRALAEKLADLDLDEQNIADTLEAEAGALEAKATNIGFVVRNLEAMADAIKTAEKGMAERRKSIERRAESLREYLLGAMKLAGIQKIESPHFVLSVAKKPPAVVVDALDLIPQAYMRVPETPPPAPDKAAIAAAIKAGHEVPGAHLEAGERLAIR